MNTGSEAMQIEELVRTMNPITLADMDSIRLMNRTDTKYLTDTVTLAGILDVVAERDYMVFENSGTRIQEYRSLYYDTPDLGMYVDHHNCRLTRQKLRTRCYVGSNQTFLELKSKNNHGRTKKKRIEIHPALYRTDIISDAEEVSWLNGKLTYASDRLSPALETCFSRITLVDSERTERSTIDMELVFNNPRKGTCADIGNAVVIEVKQDGNRPSRFRDILLEYRVKPVRISKYCIGTAMTDTSVRSGRFKHKLIMIDKLNNVFH